MEHGNMITSLETLEFFDVFLFTDIDHLGGIFDQRLWHS